MLDRLKLRLKISGTDEDILLEDIIQSATALYLKLKYPYGAYPVDTGGDPVLDIIASDWILRCSIEMYSRQGAESQTSHSENGISRGYDSGTVSLSLIREITSVCGVANANS